MFQDPKGKRFPVIQFLSMTKELFLTGAVSGPPRARPGAGGLARGPRWAPPGSAQPSPLLSTAPTGVSVPAGPSGRGGPAACQDPLGDGAAADAELAESACWESRCPAGAAGRRAGPRTAPCSSLPVESFQVRFWCLPKMTEDHGDRITTPTPTPGPSV